MTTKPDSAFQITDHTPSLAEYQALRTAVGWACAPDDITRAALEASLFAVTARDRAGAVIGMGRLTGDQLYCFAVDLAVLPDFQRHGVGRRILTGLVDFALAQHIPTIGLIADDTVRGFYERHGLFQHAGHYLRLAPEQR